jgi:hypothetical protein
MERALRSSGCRTKRAAIESGLRLLVQVNNQMKLRSLKGKISSEGDQCLEQDFVGIGDLVSFIRGKSPAARRSMSSSAPSVPNRASRSSTTALTLI